MWLGGRDSNPDSQIQSLESYHWTTSHQGEVIYGWMQRLSTAAFETYPVTSISPDESFYLPGVTHRTHNGSTTKLRCLAGRRGAFVVYQLIGSGFLKGWKKQMSTDKSGDDPTTEPMEQRLRSLIAEHEAKLKEVADLVAHVRHEINNPLTGVIGQAQLLLREELSSTARRRVETIEHLAARIKDTVAQLRDVQRPPQQQEQPTAEETDKPPRY